MVVSKKTSVRLKHASRKKPAGRHQHKAAKAKVHPKALKSANKKQSIHERRMQHSTPAVVRQAQEKPSVKHVKAPDSVLKVVSMKVIEDVAADEHFSAYVNSKIGENTVSVMKELSIPKTDDAVAENLQLRINDVRRILNLLNTDGVARYVVNKNSKGWLSFKWYIDEAKLNKLMSRLKESTAVVSEALPENVGDFFICEKCEATGRFFTLDEVFQSSFKCEKGHILKRIDRQQAAEIRAGKPVF